MKRVIVTGATGFVGANLARRLIRDGHEVHLLVRPAHNPWRINEIRDAVTLHETALDEPSALLSIVSEVKPDWIFHLAAYGAYSTQTDVERTFRTNVLGTVNLVQACLKVGFEAFVNTGSSSEYGFKDHSPAEDEALDPNSQYAVAKAAATLFCRQTARQEQVHIPTIRLYSVFGPYEEPARLMPTLILRGLRGEFPPLVNPDIARDFVYAEDVNDAFLAAATQQGQELGAIYNVGTGIQTSLREAVDHVRHVLDIRDNPQWGTMPNRSWDTTSWVADCRRIRSSLGWFPKYSFEQGFSEFVHWFRDNPELERFYRHEGSKKL